MLEKTEKKSFPGGGGSASANLKYVAPGPSEKDTNE